MCLCMAISVRVLPSIRLSLTRWIQYSIKGATSNPHAYMIGEEKVFIQKAIYRRYVPMSSLLMDYLFGIKYEKLKQFKVNETNSTITCHLSTNESIDKLFSIQGLSPVTFKRDGISYAACGFLRILTLMIWDQPQRI